MKQLILGIALALLPIIGIAAVAPGKLPSPRNGMIKVAVVLSKGATVIDFAGPWQVFQDTSVKDAQGKSVTPYELYTVAPGKLPVHTDGSNHPGLTITPDYSFANAPTPDIVVLGAQSGGRGLNAWLLKVHAEHKTIMSVCTGAFLLAKTGLLNGKQATTHHWFFGNFAREFPKVQLMKEVRYVQSGPTLLTAGGETSGIDLALHMVAMRFDQDVAQQTANYMEYQGTGWKTNEGVSTSTTPVTHQTWSGQMASGTKVVLHIVMTGSSPTMTVDIPAQHVVAAVATPNKTHNHLVGMTVHIPGHAAVFTGTTITGGDAVSGSFTQDGKTYPLTLAKQTVSIQTHADRADVDGVGVIKAIDTSHDTITLHHEPIAALGWPAMTMVLKVASPDLLTRAKVGEKIRFTLYPDDMDSIITAIKPFKP